MYDRSFLSRNGIQYWQSPSHSNYLILGTLILVLTLLLCFVIWLHQELTPTPIPTPKFYTPDREPMDEMFPHLTPTLRSRYNFPDVEESIKRLMKSNNNNNNYYKKKIYSPSFNYGPHREPNL
ncbi:uncharacterized protein LOC129572313 [Sitodiplosis mosellana]|uniref:uncharacterized protein LOC129572313 n=1 Tax=Sitodiplosis mosellana TaxID=263140 RepID=UPI00244491D0|nr:uncharacterized protein LOC129572313 [Sitodiplosis mosellana]